MSPISKTPGAGLDIRQGVIVTRLQQDADGWLLDIESGPLRARRVMVTVPAPQVAGLLRESHPLVAELTAVRQAPCLKVMAAVTGEAPFIARQESDDPLSWIAQDSSKPGRPQGVAAQWVAQAGEAFSMEHLEKTGLRIATLMLPLLCDGLGVTTDQVPHGAAHR